MGTTPPRPASDRPLLDFPYSRPEPWSWIPGTWIQPGVVFVTGEGRFYRFVERTDDGWRAEEVEPAAVGDQSRVAEIAALSARCEQVLATHDALERKMQQGEDTPANRVLIREQDRNLHGLRDQLILLCNGRSLEARAAKKPDQDRWKLTLAGVLLLVFVLALVYCVKSLIDYAPEQAGAMLAGAVFVIAGAVLSVIGVRELARRRNRLVTANLVGCFTLAALVFLTVALVVMYVAVSRR